MRFQRFCDPSVHKSFVFIRNQTGAYTLITYLTSIRFSDGLLDAMYNRNNLFAQVSQREWESFPGFLFAKSDE